MTTFSPTLEDALDTHAPGVTGNRELREAIGTELYAACLAREQRIKHELAPLLRRPGEVNETTHPEVVVRALLRAIGDNPDRSGLADTPARVVRSWNELFSGYKETEEAVSALLREFEAEGFDELVLLRGCEFFSTCEHHLLPFHGRAHVAYIPNGKRIVGLSKLARLVEVYARRLQVQERIGQQVADALERNLKPLGVAVVLEATHFCVCARGVGKQGSDMVTSVTRGAFREKPEARAELLQLIRGGR